MKKLLIATSLFLFTFLSFASANATSDLATRMKTKLTNPRTTHTPKNLQGLMYGGRDTSSQTLVG
jgi:hypothetical protein